MNKIILIKNLSFFYKKNKIFNNLNLEITSKKWTTIIGNNGSGKTTLLKLILGKLNGTGEIVLGTKNIGSVYLESEFKYKNLNEMINKLLDHEKINDKKLKKDQIINTFGMKKIFELDYKLATEDEKKVIIFISNLIIKPDVLLLDNLLDEINYKYKKKIIKILKFYQKKGMTIINFTQNTDDLLLGDEVIIIDNGKNVLSKSIESIFEDEKIFKELNLNLPFIIDLSIKLKYYRLVDRLYFSDEDLVDAIWK